MTHKRWTPPEGGWPEDKYHFSEHLQNQADWMIYRYGPDFSKAEAKKVTDAAHNWAFRYNKTVRTKHMRVDDGWAVRVTLVRMYRVIRALQGFNIKDLI